jgi:hypothetical protein
MSTTIKVLFQMFEIDILEYLDISRCATDQMGLSGTKAPQNSPFNGTDSQIYDQLLPDLQYLLHPSVLDELASNMSIFDLAPSATTKDQTAESDKSSVFSSSCLSDSVLLCEVGKSPSLIEFSRKLLQKSQSSLNDSGKLFEYTKPQQLDEEWLTWRLRELNASSDLLCLQTNPIDADLSETNQYQPAIPASTAKVRKSTGADRNYLICTQCSKKCRSLAELKRHKDRHEQAAAIQCDRCLKRFARLSGLSSHLRAGKCARQ